MVAHTVETRRVKFCRGASFESGQAKTGMQVFWGVM
uniref:Uncharacterized protein n=1 Tax=Lepeophtheirus salmonis TaxID=72036 RepID=A0A0K2UBY1_LEPSM